MTFGNLYLIRHGETLWAKNKQYTGCTNISLTEYGEKQAKNIAPYVQGLGVRSENIYVSPLKRAQQTAIVAGIKNFKTEPLLVEWDYGKLEGHRMSEVTKVRGKVWDIFSESVDFDEDLLPPLHLQPQDADNLAPIGSTPGETADEVVKRAHAFLELVLPTLKRGEDVLCVAHAHLLRVLALEFLGLDVSLGQKLRFDNCAISTLTEITGFRTIQEWNVKYGNL